MGAIDIIRTALLITLPVTLLAVLYRKFRLRTLMKEMPAPLHAELIALEVAYHPVRVRALVKLPVARRIGTALLDERYAEFLPWPEEPQQPGERWIERDMERVPDGAYFFQLSTETQRTVRRLVIRRA